MWVDGEKVDEKDINGLIIKNGVLRFGFQSSCYPNKYYGLLDEIRIYNRALCEEEIQVLYKLGFPGSLEGFVYDPETGEPLQGARVSIGGLVAFTDEEGCFELSLCAGTYTLSVSLEGYYDWSGEVTVEANATSSLYVPLRKRQEGEVVVTGVSSRHTGDNRLTYFLEGVSLEETFQAQVDWGGHEPGVVRFIAPEGTYESPEGSWTFDVGRGFRPGESLLVEAESADGTRSERVEAGFSVMVDPGIGTGWTVEDLGDRLLYRTSIEGVPLIEEGVEEGAIPEEIPYFGGRTFEFQSLLSYEVTVTSNGTAQVTATLAGAQGDIAGCSFSLSPRFHLEGVYRPDSMSWDWDGYLGIAGNVSVSSTWPFVFMAGPIPVPMFLKASFSLEADATLGITDWTASGPALAGEFGLEPYVRGLAGVGVDSFLSVSGFVGGGAEMDLQFPQEPTLKELCIFLNGGFEIYAMLWQQSFEALRWEWELAGGEAGAASLAAPLLMGEWRPYPRRPLTQRFLGGGLRGARAWTLASGARVRATTLAEDVFPYAEPSIACGGGSLLLAWVRDDPERADMNRTELVCSRWEGDRWSDPIPVADDGTADFCPQLLVFGDGQALVAWMDEGQVLPNDATFEEARAALEISAAHYDPASGTWLWSRLTANGCLDFSPRLDGPAPDDAILVWVQNEANDWRGGPDCPSQLLWSRWDGAAWSTPQLLATLPQTLVKLDFAYNGQRGLLVYAADMDGDLTTPEDQELFALVYQEGSWSGPQRLTDDEVCDANPQVAFDPQGRSLLVWLRGDDLVCATELDVEGRQVISSPGFASTTADFRLAMGEDGRIVLVWPDASEQGSDLWAAFYDPTFERWGAHQRITFDEQMEREPRAAVCEDAVVVVYEAVQMEEQAAAATLRGGRTLSYSVPVPGETNLVVLWHTIEGDLAVTDLHLEPSNPAPGQQVTVWVTVANLGDVVADQVEVALYLGDPSEGGELIGSVLLDEELAPGQSAQVQLEWTVPEMDEPLELAAVVDPAHNLSDRDWTNNTALGRFVRPDLVAAAASWGEVGPERRYIVLRVKNQGAIASPPCTVTFRLGSLQGQAIGTAELEGIAPEGWADVGLVWDLEGWSFEDEYVEVYAIVDEAQEVDDLDRDNNWAAVAVRVLGSCRADLDADGDVDGSDLVAFAEAYVDGDPLADLNADGRVDEQDATVFASELGRANCPRCGAAGPDLDADGDVDGGDLAAFASYYEAGGLRADLDGDGEVTVDDLLLFAQGFGR